MISSTPKQASRPQRADRPRVAFFVFMLMLGATVSGVERFRPGMIEPARHRLSSSLSGYFRPLLEATQGGRRLANRVGQLWGVESDFRRVERELMEARLELQLAREQLHRMGRISGLRQWRGPEELEFALADVIGFSTGGTSAEWIINRGAMDGMEAGLPVVGQNGLAGVIREVSERTSRVQALTDPQSAVGVAEREDRNRGIVFGGGRDMPLEFIPENENTPIVPGTQLITSGFGNSVYPKGIVVGTIKARRRNFRGVDFGVVEPAETFNALEEVLVIMRAEAAPPPGPMEGLGSYSFAIEAEAEAEAEASARDGDEEEGDARPPGPETTAEASEGPPLESAPP